jgi:hypothetical protein
MWVLILALRAAAAAGRDEESVSPVEKVLELMNSLYAQVEDEGKEEAATYKKFACFCKDTQLSKDKAIKDGNDNESDQLATIEQMNAKEASLTQSITDLNNDLDNGEQSLIDATNERAEQKAKYDKKHTDTVNSVEGVRTAMADIAGATSFVEKEAILKSSKVQALINALDPGTSSRPMPDVSLVSITDIGDKSREHAGLGASSSITEVLDALLDDWTKKAKRMEDNEKARKDLYDKTSAELRKMIKDTEAAIDAAKIQLSETAATLAKTKGQLTETKANLHDDTKYLKDLTAQCEMKANEWDQRSTMRAGELKALQEAIDIVGGSVAKTAGTRGYTDNSEAFLQGGAPAKYAYTDVVFTQLKEVKKAGQTFAMSAREKQERLDAVNKIHDSAKTLKSSDLSLLAMRIAADPFAKVKELIQQLITRLLTESQNEATQKGWCDTEIGKANTDRDHRMADTKSLSAEALVLEAEKKNQEELIKTLSEELAAVQSDHSEATRIREAEKAENKKTLEDSREGLTAVTKALETLKKFYGKGSRANQSGYAFTQTASEQSPAAADMAAAGVTGAQGNYEGNQAAGGGIIGMLEVIQSDFKRSIEMAETAEKESSTEYASYNKEAKASMMSKETGLENAKDDLKIASGDLVATLNKLKDNQKLLDMSLQALETLRPACVDTGMSWEEKVKRRDAEIQALKDALAVFEDPNGLGFLQK